MNTMGYWLDRPAEQWEHAGLCGDGSLGAMVMCGVKDEAIVLSHEKLTAPVAPYELPPRMGDYLSQVRQLIRERRFQEAEDLPMRLGGTYYTLDNTRWQSPLYPVCQIGITTLGAVEAVDYQRTCDFATGVAEVSFGGEAGRHSRQVFISRADHAGIIRLSSAMPESYVVTLSQRPDPDADSDWAKRLRCVHPEAPEITPVDQGLMYSCAFEKLAVAHGCALVVKQCDGGVNIEGGCLSIENARECVMAFALFEKASEALSEVARLRALPGGYDTLLSRQKASHGEAMQRVVLHLADTGLETRFNAGRYEMLSACGEHPPRLQGVWSAIYAAPWGCDFTNNGNVETAIMGLLLSGMFEAMRGLLGYYESRIEAFGYNARQLYGCRGIHIPAHSGDTGVEIHYNTPFQMLFWTGGAGWIAHYFYDYWLYTRDDDYFINHALPFMKAAALFYEDFLYVGPDGRLEFNPSYSPENNPANSRSQACVNATMDVAIARELLENLITGCVTLGIDEEKVPLWRNMLARLPEYRINGDGALCEWLADDYPDRYDHRHASHLYPVYYGLPEDFRERPTLMRACRRVYQLREQYRAQEKGTMAFGYVLCGMAAAHLGDGETLGSILETLSGGYYYPTFATAHDEGPAIFNADLSGGMPALIAEAIAQCQPVTGANGGIDHYRIILLPALPESMADGEISGLRLRGGMSLNMRWEKGVVREYHVSNPLDQRYETETGPVINWRREDR